MSDSRGHELTGFLHIELFSMILPALMVVLAAGLSSGFTAGEESKGTIGVAVGLLVVTYLIDDLANIVDGLNSIRWISPFKYYMGNDPLRNGIDLGDAAVLIGATALFLIVSLIVFERRDLAA